VGDVMMDAVLAHSGRARRRSLPFGQRAGAYYLATLHRQENVDDPRRLAAIVGALERLPHPVVLPLHPRTRLRLERAKLRPGPNLRLLPPLGYLDMLGLLSRARAVLTDSGGLQKEAFILGRPCVTLRDTTEWVETLRGGANRLVGADPEAIARAVKAIEARRPRPPARHPYGDGHAARRIAERVAAFLTRRA